MTPDDDLCCPITFQLMREPVIMPASGVTYEKNAIEEWISKKGTDPHGNKLGKNERLITNRAVKGLIYRSPFKMRDLK